MIKELPKDFFKSIRKTISNGNIDEAISLLTSVVEKTPLFDELILIESRYSTIKKSFSQGLDTSEVLDIRRNRIAKSILDLTNNIESLKAELNTPEIIIGADGNIDQRLNSILKIVFPNFLVEYLQGTIIEPENIKMLFSQLKAHCSNEISSNHNKFRKTYAILEDLSYIVESNEINLSIPKGRSSNLTYFILYKEYFLHLYESSVDYIQIINFLSSDIDTERNAGIIVLLSLYLESLKDKKDNFEEQYRYQISELSLVTIVLWRMGRFHLIIYLIQDSLEEASLQDIFIYVISLIQENHAIDDILKITKEIENKSRYNYKIWIRLAHIYNLILIDYFNFPHFPKIMNLNDKFYDDQSLKIYTSLFTSAIKYLDMAFEYLYNQILPTHEEIKNRRSENIFFALFLNITMIGFIGKKEILLSENFQEKLIALENISTFNTLFKHYNQIAFGIYFLRRAFIGEDEKIFRLYLKKAEKNLSLIDQKILDPDGKIFFDEFEKYLKKAKRKSYWFWNQ